MSMDMVFLTREGMAGWVFLHVLFLRLCIRRGYFPRLDLTALPPGEAS